MTATPTPEAPAREEEPEFLSLDEFTCFVLYAAQRAMTSAYRPLIDHLGLTYPQYLVLVALYESGPCSVKGLGAKLHLDYGTLTPLLKRLEANGLVTRQRRADDERQVDVSLTEEGVALRRNARTVIPSLNATMGLTDEESKQLKTLLRKLTHNLTAAQDTAKA
ncbi:MarR family winged helix-turn-helix transcriptional regulator [Nocardia higoensis]|uniref:MarR family winged helix-turn-helix transcriptional regulator n=1 Tax=Nocardia higoensis TaxID=228599 RepID=UPI0002D6D9D4|nr:MarR family transcriptional regulator [Nocardia higoensis]